MNHSDVERLVGDTFVYWGRKIPGQDTILAWADELKNMHSKACEYIRKAICDLDAWPSNWCKAVRKAYREWYQNNETEVVGEERQAKGCSHCERGLLFLTRNDATCIAQCGHCAGVGSTVLPTLTVQKARALGYEPDPKSPWAREIEHPVSAI